MKITNILPCYSPVNFNSGKISLYTDFDGTYFPFEQSLIKNNDKQTINSANKMYSGFKKFIQSAKENFKIIITTARSKWEVKEALDDINSAQIDFPKPQSYILLDGYHETDDIYAVDDCLRINGNNSDKLDRPKQKARQIVQSASDDLVIVAGDDYNDMRMLNPLNYIDILGLDYNFFEPLEKTLERKDIQQALKKLPVMFIVCAEGENLQYILNIKKILDSFGIKKIFQAKNPEEDLLKTIQESMVEYSKENEEFKKSMPQTAVCF